MKATSDLQHKDEKSAVFQYQDTESIGRPNDYPSEYNTYSSINSPPHFRKHLPLHAYTSACVLFSYCMQTHLVDRWKLEPPDLANPYIKSQKAYVFIVIICFLYSAKVNSKIVAILGIPLLFQSHRGGRWMFYSQVAITSVQYFTSC